MNLFRQFVKTTVDVADFHAMRKRAEDAAAQLAEKEREIARLTESNVLIQQAFAERTQLLQEYRDVCGDLSPSNLEILLDKQFERIGVNQLTDLIDDIPTISELRERLRQREAELEHLREQQLIDRPEGSTS